MTTLFFIRHGQSTANLLRVFAGQMDYPLTEQGLRQAEKGAAFLKKNFSIDAVYSSPLSRAKETAEPTARLFGLEVNFLEDLRERSIGIWAGRPNHEIKELYPEMYYAHKRREGVVPEGGESPAQMQERANRAVTRILAENKGKNVAVFTHAGVFTALFARWKEMLPELADVAVFGNSSITALEYDDEGIARRVILKNYQDHLGNDVTVVPRELL